MVTRAKGGGSELPSLEPGNPSQTTGVVEPLIKRHPVPRKGHRKSRAGCNTCKRRKVKCDEATPECEQCRRLGLTYQYASDGHVLTMGTVRRPLRTAPTTFGLEDLRYFQHFLFSAHPSLPIGGADVWRQVGQMAHRYDFLAHAMLGLGASHLEMLGDGGHSQAALKHRVTALKALNSHLKEPNLSLADADAALGAMLSLMFQSAYISDGLIDFFTMVRGCFIMGTSLFPDFDKSTFQSLGRESYVGRVQELIGTDKADHVINNVLVEEFCASLERLRPLCLAAFQLHYLKNMQKLASAAATDPAQSVRYNAFLYEELAVLSVDEYGAFIDPENYVSRLVILHLLALDFVMTQRDSASQGEAACSYPDSLPQDSDRRKIMSIRWMETILIQLPEVYDPYAKWVADLARDTRFSFERRDELWNPFLLHSGKAMVDKGKGDDVAEKLVFVHHSLSSSG